MEHAKNVAFITISVIAVTSILLAGLYEGNPLHSKSSLSKSEFPRHQKILIIMTQTRSGSSFTGEIFAASNSSLYFYEPLYPFGGKCDLQDGKEALLKRLLSCDLSDLKNIYSYGFNTSHYKDGGQCMQHGFCFTKASTGLLNSYAKVCTNTSQDFHAESKACGYPLKAKILSKLCRSKNLIITKITRICSMEELEKVYRHLVVSGKREVYVLHLVRDLRSIASSIIKLKKRYGGIINKETVHVERYCERQRHNVEYVEKHFTESKIIGDKRYIRVRYEDLLMNADEKAGEVFRFMDRSLPPEVVANIHNHLHPSKSISQETSKEGAKETEMIHREYANPFGVVRDPSKLQDEWRKIVPFEIVKQIQEKCGDVLKKNGYVIFSNEDHMKDLSLPSFHDLDWTVGSPKI